VGSPLCVMLPFLNRPCKWVELFVKMALEVAWLEGKCIRDKWYNADSFDPLNTDPNSNCRYFYKGALSSGRIVDANMTKSEYCKE
jgi:hypothetical protein